MMNLDGKKMTMTKKRMFFSSTSEKIPVLVVEGELQLPEERHDEVGGESPQGSSQCPGQAVRGWLVSRAPSHQVTAG